MKPKPSPKPVSPQHRKLLAELDAMLNEEIFGVDPDKLTLAQAKALYAHLYQVFRSKP